MAIPAWLSWFIAIIRGVLGIRAEIQQKREEHVGEVIQQNADLIAQNGRDEAALKADANAPATKADKLKALEEGAE
jgi:hypothetical protein